MPTKPSLKPFPRASAEAASHALRAALAERLVGRLSLQGETGGSAAELAMGALARLPDAAPRKLQGAA